MTELANVSGATRVALNGYDPITFFADTKNPQPTNGSHEISTMHNGVTYYFCSNENRATFQGNPDRYVPQMGGFCAFGVAKGGLFPADVTKTAQIYKDKLYVNLNPTMQGLFNQDLDGNIAKAEENWKKLQEEHKMD